MTLIVDNIMLFGKRGVTADTQLAP